MHNAPSVEQLARAFAGQLRAELGKDKLTDVIARNEVHRHDGAYSICASHDFCDANMTMLAALEQTYDARKLPFDRGAYVDALGNGDQAEVDLWNAAWTMAVENQFWISEAHWSDEA